MTNLSRAIDLFCKEWPEGSEVTHDSIVRAAAIGLNLEWFASLVLPPRVFADYKARRAALHADYEAKSAELYADYKAKRAALLIPALLNHFGELPASNAAKEGAM